MGLADRIIRITMAAFVAVLYFNDVISGTAAIVMGALALVFALTSAVSFCPLYLPFKINTARKKQGRS